MTQHSLLDRVCLAWDTATATEAVLDPVPCNAGLMVGDVGEQPRFAYVSFASPIEVLLSCNASVHMHDRRGGDLTLSALQERLLAAEVAAVLAPRKPIRTGAIESDVALSDEFTSRRQALRCDNVLIRFLLRQIGLAEVASHRGAPATLYSKAAALWSRDLALCTDPAMLLSLGADRQRYVDAEFNARAIDRLPRALGRLHALGVRSYPRLVIV